MENKTIYHTYIHTYVILNIYLIDMYEIFVLLKDLAGSPGLNTTVKTMDKFSLK